MRMAHLRSRDSRSRPETPPVRAVACRVSSISSIDSPSPSLTAASAAHTHSSHGIEESIHSDAPFYSKFLILSGGQDQQLGVFLYSNADAISASLLIANENNAMQLSVYDGSFPVDFTASETISPFTIGTQPSPDPTHPWNYDLQQAALDDISNQNIQTTLGIGGSGS